MLLAPPSKISALALASLHTQRAASLSDRCDHPILNQFSNMRSPTFAMSSGSQPHTPINALLFSRNIASTMTGASRCRYLIGHALAE